MAKTNSTAQRAAVRTFKRIFPALLSVAALYGAESMADEKGVMLSIMGGQAMFDSESELEDDTFYSIGIGYDFGNRFAAEFSYLSTEPEYENIPYSVDTQHLRLDGLYYFGQDKLRPYLVAGVGQAEYTLSDSDQDSTDTIVNAGAGVKYWLNDYVALRGDARAVYSTDIEETDTLVGVGLTFKFGASSTSKPAPAPKVKPEKDSDNDGVLDSMDKCPGTPAGTKVDANGCAVKLDSDNDGVVDSLDKCPDTEAGAKVDSNGCYEALSEQVSVYLAVNFATNSDKVLEGAYDEVKKVADFMRQYPKTDVIFEGHTDDSGAAAYNRDLSQRRANAVAKILIEQFDIDRDRVTAVGYGEDKPLVDNSTPANRAKNRRVVAIVSATVETLVK